MSETTTDALDAQELARDAAPLPDDQALASVAQLAERQRTLESEIAETEARLAELKADLQRVSTGDLPTAMAAAGVRDFRTVDGARVEVQSFVQASIPKARRPEAHAWLHAHGLGDIVKHEITVRCGKGEDAVAELAKDVLTQAGLHPDDTESVHPQTLKAVVRERIESGELIPFDLFGVHVGDRARITPAKK